MNRLIQLVALMATLCSVSCGPGGVGCTVLNVVGLPNRSPVRYATIFSYRESTPADRYRGHTLSRPGSYDPTALSCSGELMIEISHRDYQTLTVRYRSPRDRVISGNAQVDEQTVEMTPR